MRIRLQLERPDSDVWVLRSDHPAHDRAVDPSARIVVTSPVPEGFIANDMARMTIEGFAHLFRLKDEDCTFEDVLAAPITCRGSKEMVDAAQWIERTRAEHVASIKDALERERRGEILPPYLPGVFT